MGESKSPDKYLAKPSEECCLKGSLREGEARGRLGTVAGVEIYIARPFKDTDNSHIMLYFPDVRWVYNTRPRLLSRGFSLEHRKDRNDTTSEPGFEYQAWLAKHTAFADEVVPKWVDAVKKEYGSPFTKYGCVGYCFGPPYVCNELAEDNCAAGAWAHPAFLKDKHFCNLKMPLFLSCAEIDHTIPAENRNKAVEIMDTERKHYQLQLIQGVQHGFALRGNMENAYERYTKEQSLKGHREVV